MSRYGIHFDIEFTEVMSRKPDWKEQRYAEIYWSSPRQAHHGFGRIDCRLVITSIRTVRFPDSIGWRDSAADRHRTVGKLGRVVTARPLELLQLLAHDEPKSRWQVLGQRISPRQST